MSSFPQAFTSTVSYWQASNRGRTSLYNHGKDDPLPKRAKCVIIGAGMTGASLAYQLSKAESELSGEGSILILEAKDVASGATGRNGGHVRPASFHAYPRLITPLVKGGAGHTPEEALRVLENEEENIRLVGEIVEREGLNLGEFGGVEWRMGESVVAYRNEAERVGGRAALEAYTVARQELGHKPAEGITFVDDAAEAQRISRVKEAVACSITPAGMVHPHKLATALLRLALGSGKCQLHSWTPVSVIERSESGWVVRTSKGDVLADRVVLASNAHTRHLWETPDLPFSRLITTNRGHCCHVTPPTNYSGTGAYERSVVWGGTYARDVAGAGWVMGCGPNTIGEYKLAPLEEVYDVVDDSILTTGLESYFKVILSDTFADWNELPGEGTSRVWSGIIGYSRDKLPFVGPIPRSEGLYAAVAFHGHGMSRILCCTRALAAQMLDPQQKWDERLPRSFEITPARIERALAAPPLYTPAPRLAIADQGAPPPEVTGGKWSLSGALSAIRS